MSKKGKILVTVGASGLHIAFNMSFSMSLGCSKCGGFNHLTCFITYYDRMRIGKLQDWKDSDLDAFTFTVSHKPL